ncbi:MAG: DUF4870 domain-containing protein [Blastocatellia bacterium]|nr:DUF4870 domain-containing protein [Blastocatellia bacterium]
MSYNMEYRPPMALQTADEKQMGLILHLSGLAFALVFPLGIVLPIILWQTQKDKIPALDVHGKMVTNWMISATIYAAVSFVLMFVLVGFLTGLAVWLMAIIFPIIGALKANNEGEMWQYPLTIKFLK